VRYSTRFDFPIDPDTLQAIKDHAASLLPSVAIERIWQEFCKMAQFAHFDKGLLILHELHLLGTIFPKLKDVSLQELEKRLKAIDHFPKNAPPIAELLELFPNYSLEELIELCNYLKLSRKDRDFVEFYHHAISLFAMPEDWQQKLEPIEWAHFYGSAFAEVCIAIVAAHFSSEKKEHFLSQHLQRQSSLSSHIERIRSKKPLIRAEHLMQEGLSAGKKMGELLVEAERISVNQNIDDPSKVLDILKRSPLWPSS
jgi:poly(A) polymerase